ncbi:glycerol kinase GlpK [Psychrobacter sp. FDAARGOS_221]|uniref:glycerol kinase GlpK n=1 Tax=Psychrobacter sp. FDAARGOS_221 TaxID=1975705 RepID=UPI000BB52E22|nr:glycerol kinase GlpK [Psychrobacter sp. FDAARGOS_221]PNK60008.1 glycerol kinase [Psychrobacter sp. FDAARGOS_221]
MAGYILALDQGTTSSRAIIYDDRARPIQVSQQETTLITPKAGYVEQDAMQIWHTQISCAHDAINQAGLLATDISSLAITNQRETIVFWDKRTGKPLAPAIIWQDRRSDSWCQQLQKQQLKDSDVTMQQHVQQVTGLRLDPYFSASKIVWMLDNHPNLKDRAQRGEVAVGTIDSWLMFKLTGGEHVIDISNASRTLMYDINKLQWSDELLSKFDVSKQMLPKVIASDGDFGKTKKGLFAKQIPIQAVLGDQQAALFGQGCVSEGMAKNTYGTGCFMLMNIGHEVQLSQHQLLTTVGWQRRLKHQQFIGNQIEHPSLSKLVKSGQRILNPARREVTYALEGSVFMAGAIVQWLRDNLGLFYKSQDVERLANEVESSEEVVLVPAFTGLGAPYWRSDITASIFGMTRGSSKAHIARAALESIAFQTYDVLTAMQKDSPSPLTELRVDGGASNNNLLMQFQADMLGVPVLRPKDTEITAKGVALLAGINAGLYDETTIDDSWHLDRCFEPQMSADEREQHLHKWHQAISKTLQ